MAKLFPVVILRCFITAVTLLFISTSYAGIPLWTFTPNPNFPPNISVNTASSATIKYTVTNQSKTTHTLVMTPIAGITQITTPGNCPNPFTLGYQQSCLLTLFVKGSVLPGNVHGGPVVCQQGNPLQCYQPSPANSLSITRIPFAQYVITPFAGPNGVITPNTPVIVTAGSNVTFTATPNTGFQVDQWLVDGGIAQIGGSTFTLSSIITNHNVEALFTQAGTIFAGAENGYVYLSNNNGITWSATTPPSVGNAVNSVFATATTLYAGSADTSVYYSTNNGTSWNHTNPLNDGTAVNGVFVQADGTIYATSNGGHIFFSTDQINWQATIAQPGSGGVNGIFITSSSTIYVGSNDGNVYSSTDNGGQWNPISGPINNPSFNSYAGPVQNVFAISSTSLYVNTRHTSTNPTLPNPTIDFEYVFFTTDIGNTPTSWMLNSQLAYTLFVNSDASIILAGTQDGFVYSLTTGNELGFIANTAINSLYFLG